MTDPVIPVTYKVVDTPWSPSDPAASQEMLTMIGQEGWVLSTVYPDPQRERTRWIFSSPPASASTGGVSEAPIDGALYGRQNAAWSTITLTVGPPGPQGAQGPQGPQGPQGSQGIPGPTLVSANAGNQARLGTDSLIYVPPLKGTVAGDDAAAGNVGEFLAVSNTTGTQLTTAITANVASLSLPAGDWTVAGIVIFTPAGTGPNSVLAGVNTLSATLPTDNQVLQGGTTMFQAWSGSLTAGKPLTLPVGMCRINITAATNVYLVAQASFGGGSVTVTGRLTARRVR